MKKKIILAVVVLAVSVCVLCACTTDANMLKTGENDSFLYSTLASLQNDWDLSTEDSYSISNVFSLEDNALVINTASSGWAKAEQEVELKANSFYLVEYHYSATTFTSYGDKGYDGLYISFREDDDFNSGDNEVHHRSANSGTVGKFYFRSNSSGMATFTINVGSEEYPVKVSEVKISDIKLIKVTAAQVESDNASYFVYESDYYGVPGPQNVVWVVLGGIAVLLLGYIAYVLFRRNLVKNQEYKSKFLQKIRDSKYLGIFLVGAVAIIIRLMIDLLTTFLAGAKTYSSLGYTVEGFASQALFIGRYGTVYLSESLARFCTDNGFTYMAVGSNPILLYLLGSIGLISRIFDPGSQYLAATFLVKLLASIADIGTAVLIFALIKKHAGNVGASIISLLYVALPTVFGLSALWGFAESITVFFIVLSVYFMLKNNYYGVSISYFVAFLCSYSALIFAPIVIFYSIQQAINQPKLRIAAPVAFVTGFILFYLLNLPFDIRSVSSGSPFVCVTNYWNAIFHNLLYTRNAFNFQALLGNNFGEVTNESLIVTIVFVVFMLALVGFGYFKNKNRMNLLLLGTAFINMYYMFANNMTPEVMAMSLALMLIYAIMAKDRRIYFAFVCYAAISFVNLSIGELLYAYTTTGIYRIAYDTATIYVFSALALLVTLLYIYFTYEAVVSKNVKKIQPMPMNYLNWCKSVLLKVRRSYYKLRNRRAK
ncbi:MAG: hypothetical protein IJ735_00355 [Clostridia bacterium]|nr:hypothetical protein [Clostridia bacterium]